MLLQTGITLKLESSDDTGDNWTDHGTKTGRHMEWSSLGWAETDRIYRITSTTGAKFVVVDAYVDVEPGEH